MTCVQPSMRGRCLHAKPLQALLSEKTAAERSCRELQAQLAGLQSALGKLRVVRCAFQKAWQLQGGSRAACSPPCVSQDEACWVQHALAAPRAASMQLVALCVAAEA